MDFRYAEEHVQLRDGVRRLLSDAASDSATREAMSSDRGWHPGTYRRLAGELGVVGLGIPEELGGSGYGVLELGVVLQEAGRSLVCAPLLSSAVAGQALLATGDEGACAAYLPQIAAGELLGTLAPLERDESAGTVGLSAEPDGTGGWVVSGRRAWVVDAATADVVLLPARTAGGLSLFAVEPRSAPGVEVRPVEGVDPTRRQACVTVTRSPARLLGTEGGAVPALDRSMDVALTLLAAEQLGVAERCLQMATDYAKQREQFGRPIGSFQAIKHKLADVLLEVEAATSAVMYALWVADQRPELLPLAARIAAATASEAALLAAGESLQVHGGIGATWEHPAHLYLKRATTDRYLYGDPQVHLERIADTLALDAAPTA